MGERQQQRREATDIPASRKRDRFASAGAGAAHQRQRGNAGGDT